MRAAAGREKRVRVLIVDAFDEREMYAEALRSYGYSVATASTATQALRLIETSRYDLIVHGLMLPDIPGIELAERLSAHDHTRATPRIVISGFSDDESLKAARATGCRTVLLKPCEPRMLAAEIRRVLRRPPHASVAGASSDAKY
jgi:DNA-binding response OmpR family regulator